MEQPLRANSAMSLCLPSDVKSRASGVVAERNDGAKAGVRVRDAVWVTCDTINHNEMSVCLHSSPVFAVDCSKLNQLRETLV